jgi:GTP cyclohydrolase I
MQSEYTRGGQLQRSHRIRAPLSSADGAGDTPATELTMQDMVRRVLESIGEDPDRPGLVRTPARVESSFEWLTRGYRTGVSEVVAGAVFEEPHDSMILVRDVELYSLCEHHLLPFFGKTHVAYIPQGKILGLSKIPRLVDVFARRLQIQERLTDQVADALMDVVQPRGVGVVIEAYHLCMMMRGVEKQHSKTVTSALRGVFLEGNTRDEFLRLVHNRSDLD